ncbi:hypothetical protein A3K64_01605 [Candidatus Micrarchaeota archaeon RBG_16_36_9]|nr:MAG: hypothetical protein A3K64_01605 [Candidatus Micrarchaeota archaeon RBG_16_36_9]
MINLILALLGILDIIAGISLVLPNFIVLYIGIIFIFKGIFSIVGSFAAEYFFDIMGIIDLIAGIMLLTHFSIPFFWVLLMIKGAYSIIVGLS